MYSCELLGMTLLLAFCRSSLPAQPAMCSQNCVPVVYSCSGTTLAVFNVRIKYSLCETVRCVYARLITVLGVCRLHLNSRCVLYSWGCLTDNLPSETQQELRHAYGAVSELLHHFWACFPVSSKTLEEKVWHTHTHGLFVNS